MSGDGQFRSGAIRVKPGYRYLGYRSFTPETPRAAYHPVKFVPGTFTVHSIEEIV